MFAIDLSKIQLKKTRFSTKFLIRKMLKVQFFVIARKISVKSPTQFLIFALFKFCSCFFKTKKLLSKINDVFYKLSKIAPEKISYSTNFRSICRKCKFTPGLDCAYNR